VENFSAHIPLLAAQAFSFLENGCDYFTWLSIQANLHKSFFSSFFRAISRALSAYFQKENRAKCVQD